MLKSRLDYAAKRLIDAALSFYQAALRPWLGPRCRFFPSCSDYARQAFAQHSIPHAAVLTLSRLSRCHPFHSGGFDPLPR